MNYIVSYVPFSKDGTHGNVNRARFDNEEAARSVVSEMARKHREDPAWIGIDYRLTITHNGHLILEETSAS